MGDRLCAGKSSRLTVKPDVVVCRCRGRTVKTLESRPIQIVLCLLMMFDAAVVIAEILLDLHAMRSKSPHIRLN